MSHDLGLLLLRLTVGTLLAGHGSQKLFGWFGGPGPSGFGQWAESMGFRPGRMWAYLAGSGEFFGGLLTALGLLFPSGPLAITSVMAVATRTAHWGRPIWNTQGGAELPITNIAAALALALTGPGRYSLDRLLGIRLTRRLVPLGIAAAGLTLQIADRFARSAERERAAEHREADTAARRSA